MEIPTPLEQLDKSENFEKYRTAGQIACKALDKVVQFATPGVSVKGLCELGDEFILSEVETVFTKKKYNKGIAFPTCVGVNNCPGYYSPVDDSLKISEGDLVNIELGVHIDGFPAVVGYTVVVNTTENPIYGRTAQLINAVSEASKSVLSKFKDGHKNKEVTKVIKQSASKYNCNLVFVDDPYVRTPGLYSYQMSQNVIDGKNDDEEGDYVHQMIINREHVEYDFSLRENELEENEVYAVDVVMSTGSGKLYPTEERVTVFKRNYDEKYNLKLKTSKQALSKFKGPFPISARDFMDTRVKLGVQECTKHRLLIPYGVFGCEPGQMVAKVKFTVIVRKKKPYLVAGRSMDEQLKKVSLEKPPQQVEVETANNDSDDSEDVVSELSSDEEDKDVVETKESSEEKSSNSTEQEEEQEEDENVEFTDPPVSTEESNKQSLEIDEEELEENDNEPQLNEDESSSESEASHESVDSTELKEALEAVQ